MGRFRENSEKGGNISRARRKMWISRGTIYRENKEGTHREIGKTYGEVEISSKNNICLNSCPEKSVLPNFDVQIYQQLQWLASSVASCRNSVVCGKLETMPASTLNATLEMHRFIYS